MGQRSDLRLLGAMQEEREHLFLLLHPLHFLWRECVLFSMGEAREDRTRKQSLAYVYIFTIPHAETLRDFQKAVST